MEGIRELNAKNVILKINQILFRSFNIKTPKCYAQAVIPDCFDFVFFSRVFPIAAWCRVQNRLCFLSYLSNLEGDQGKYAV
jgi:hypothetical protein